MIIINYILAGTPTKQNVPNSKPQYGRQLKSLKKESRATRLLAAIIFDTKVHKLS